MINVGLFDSTFFHQKSATYGGENNGEGSQHISWVRDQVLPVTFYTDIRLDEALGHPGNITKVAWLVEPYSISYTHYEKAIALEGVFDYILTFDRSYLSRGDKWKWYALGGSWIIPNNWGYFNKDRMFSLIGTNKTRTRGHNMRHQAAELSKMFNIDVMGHGYRDINSKVEALRRYRYSIVIENERIEGYFTEKLIDCMSQMTIPIYWGCPNIGDYFDEIGIIRFETIDQLMHQIIDIQRNDRYPDYKSALKRNYETAKKYVCAEDWIYNNLPFIFEGKS